MLAKVPDVLCPNAEKVRRRQSRRRRRMGRPSRRGDAFFAGCGGAGLRLGEALALDWTDDRQAVRRPVGPAAVPIACGSGKGLQRANPADGP